MEEGGQSALRFARLRLEKRQAYVNKLCDILKICYPTAPRGGIVLAGSSVIKTSLNESANLAAYLKKSIIAVVDTAYGGSVGLAEALVKCEELFSDQKLQEERHLLSKFFEHLAKDTGYACYGRHVTLKLLEDGCIEKLILFKDYGTEEDQEEIVRACKESRTELLWTSDCSSEGAQFVMGFGGIGGILRWPCEYESDESSDIDAAIEHDEWI